MIWIGCYSCLLYGQQEVSFQQLSKKDGLSQASVFSIIQDSTGFMWFGTRDGLNKYDGYQFKVYKKSAAANSIVGNDIRTLYFDAQKNEMWVGANNGLSKYRSHTDDFLNFLHDPSDSTSLSNNVVRQVYRDSKKRLWVGTAAGLNCLNEEDNTFERYYFNDGISNDIESHDVKAILEDKDGAMWFGTANGLYLLIENSDSNYYSFERVDEKFDWQLSDTHIKSILEDATGNFWIGTFSNGVNYWDRANNNITVYQNDKNEPNSLSHNNIRSMCLDKDDNLWVGTFDGLNFLANKTTTFKRYGKLEFGTVGLSDKSIRSVYINQQGSLWIGTYYGGINYLNEKYNQFINFKYAPHDNVLSANVVSSFEENEKGNLWIGTEGGGLNFYDVKEKRFERYQNQLENENSLSGNSVKDLLLDTDNNKLWIGTFQAGLNLLDIKKQQFQHFKHHPLDKNSLSNNNVYGLHKENNLLWILTYGGGLDILDLEKNQFYNYAHQVTNDNSLSSDYARVLLKTSEGQLWIGTENGLNKVYINDAGFPEKFEVLLPYEKIYSLQEDSNNNIWVGTFTNGFYKFYPEKNTFIHYNSADGLPGNTVFGILEANENELWLSTNNGLTKFNPKLKTFTNYNYSNGLENSEYNFNAYYKMKSGDLLFGGINGFTQFNPVDIQPNEFVPPIVFTELRKNNRIIDINDETQLLTKNINETESITFGYNEANFSLSFAALDYFSPENNHYAFMLEGIDNDWNYSVGKTAATYTIQRAGEYIFRMKGGNSDSVWNPNERQLKITVLPPPWKTWWAYLLYMAVVGAVVLGLIRFIRLRHSLQLEQLAKQQQEELHEVKMRFFTNITHEFRTPLTLILGPLKELIKHDNHPENVEKQLSLIERNTQRLLNLVNQILTFRKLTTDHEPLKVVQVNMVEFLQEIFLPFQETAKIRNINYQFQTEATEIKAWFDQDKLEKVFFNLLSNAFKFTPNGGSIKMSISQNQQAIEIRVTDTGVGIEAGEEEQIFKRFYEKSDAKQSTIKGTGIGLAISKQMVELHQGKIKVENDIDEVGAVFIVTLLKGNQHFNDTTILKEESGSQAMKKYQPVIPTYQENIPAVDSSNKKVDDNAPLLLIVEDNVDVRNYIHQIFIKDYRISTAENGQQGLEKAKKEYPTLIISDMMMPVMDGITFCKKVKKDFEVSHIPIVLLTARTAALFKIEGLKTGADDYITKPFNPEELKLRVRNIIQARQQIKTKFAKSLSFNPKEIDVTSADELFLEKALQLVETHIENYDFNVNQFANEMAVSRPLLFTKLKALTGQTPNNFIKNIRLKRAAQLIQTKKLNISEVAYKVGFKDPKYFRKCFKDQFNVTPSDFKATHLN